MPYAPIYLPPASPPSPAVLAAEHAIREAEGPHHVAGVYYADAATADRARRAEAERLARDAAYLARAATRRQP